MFATNANANGLSMPGPSSSSSYPFGLSGLAAAPGEVAALTGAFEGLGGFGRSATPPSPAVHYHVASMSAAERPQGLGTDVSDESVEKMRRWFSRMIFQPLAAAIKDVDSALEAEGLAHLTTRASFLAYPAMELLAVVNVAKGGLKELSPSAPAPQQPQPTGLFGMKPATTAFGGFGTGFGQPAAAAQPVKPATLGALLQARPHDPMVRKRLLLEMYLTLPPVADMYARFPRDYVVARITELAQGGMLAAYRWDGGGSFAGEAWSRTRPTDAELVMHCFLTFMDIQIQMAGIAVSNLTPFTSRYYVSQDSKPGEHPVGWMDVGWGC